jgi:hypothetical protein
VTKLQAKRYVCRVLAATLRNEFDNGSGWLEEEPNGGAALSEADQARVRAASEEMIDELLRRSGGP